MPRATLRYEDPGHEDPGHEDPGYEDPGHEDPRYEQPRHAQLKTRVTSGTRGRWPGQGSPGHLHTQRRPQIQPSQGNRQRWRGLDHHGRFDRRFVTDPLGTLNTCTQARPGGSSVGRVR
jgi:hypothetical protein